MMLIDTTNKEGQPMALPATNNGTLNGSAVIIYGYPDTDGFVEYRRLDETTRYLGKATDIVWCADCVVCRETKPEADGSYDYVVGPNGGNPRDPNTDLVEIFVCTECRDGERDIDPDDVEPDYDTTDPRI